jgi:hypothetical protein
MAGYGQERGPSPERSCAIPVSLARATACPPPVYCFGYGPAAVQTRVAAPHQAANRHGHIPRARTAVDRSRERPEFAAMPPHPTTPRAPWECPSAPPAPRPASSLPGDILPRRAPASQRTGTRNGPAAAPRITPHIRQCRSHPAPPEGTGRSAERATRNGGEAVRRRRTSAAVAASPCPAIGPRAMEGHWSRLGRQTPASIVPASPS